MDRPSFDVLAQPWIPVIRPDGSRTEMGILPCLQQAHALREIRDPAPIVEFGLHRLLVAFALDAFTFAGLVPDDPLDLKTIMDAGCFDSEMMERYVQECGEVFDLLHPERPFLQIKMDGARPKPLAGLFPPVPSGTNVNHWHHQHEAKLTVSVPEAARLLATIAPFMTAGGAGLSPSINGAPAIYALPMGRTLFETIVLNIPLRSDRDSGDGVVAWRSSRLPGQERARATTAEALTWRPRRIQLVPEIGDGHRAFIRQMKFEKGDSTRLTWIDASLAYRYDKDKVTPVRMREGRPMWRDAGPLSLLNDRDRGENESKVSFRRPDVVEQAFAAARAGDGLVIQAYGVRTDMKMKIFEWAKCTWTVPPKLGRSTRLGSLVHRELYRAEQAAYGLRNCVKALYPRQGVGNKSALRTIADRCERTYWQLLEPGFNPLMSAFGAIEGEAVDDPMVITRTASSWRAAISDLARQQFELAAEDMDADSDALERQVRARAWLDNTLRKVVP